MNNDQTFNSQPYGAPQQNTPQPQYNAQDPFAQPGQQPQTYQPVQPQQPSTPSTGGSKFPSMGAPIYETPAPIEPVPTQEVHRAPEIQPSIESPKPINPKPSATTEPMLQKPTTKPVEKKPNVVEVKEPFKAHPVGAQADTLTSLADKDEEDFIKEVLHAHEHS